MLPFKEVKILHDMSYFTEISACCLHRKVHKCRAAYSIGNLSCFLVPLLVIWILLSACQRNSLLSKLFSFDGGGKWVQI